MSRAEPRTAATEECPDVAHEHRWVRAGSPAAGDLLENEVRYQATVTGCVVLSEEALAELLQLAGFTAVSS